MFFKNLNKISAAFAIVGFTGMVIYQYQRNKFFDLSKTVEFALAMSAVPICFGLIYLGFNQEPIRKKEIDITLYLVLAGLILLFILAQGTLIEFNTSD